MSPNPPRRTPLGLILAEAASVAAICLCLITVAGSYVPVLSMALLLSGFSLITSLRHLRERRILCICLLVVNLLVLFEALRRLLGPLLAA